LAGYIGLSVGERAASTANRRSTRRSELTALDDFVRIVYLIN
jgi:hypothetical protein